MNIQLKLLIAILLGFVLFGVGYMTGRSGDSDVNTRIKPVETRNTVEFPSSQSKTRTTLPSTDVPVSLEAIFSKPSVFEVLRFTHDGIATMSADQVQSLALDAVDSDYGAIKNSIIVVCLRRLTDIDPIATLEFIDSNPRLAVRNLSMLVIANWLYLDPPGVVQYVSNMEAGPQQTQFARRLVGEYSLREAGLTYQLDHILGPEAEKFRMAKQVNAMGPAEAYRVALTAGDPRTRRSLLTNALTRWAAEDPVAAIREAASLSDESLRISLVTEVFRSYVSHDPVAAIAYIEQFSGHKEMTQSLIHIAADQAPLLALPLVEAHVLRTGNDHSLRSLLASWANTQPEQAIAYIDAMDEQDRLKHYQAVYRVYLQKQPKQAIDWVVSRFNDSPLIAGAALQQSVSAQSIDYALHVLNTTNTPGVRSNLIPSIAIYKMQTDQDAALDWLEGYRNDASYETALLNIIGSMAYSSPAKAAAALTPMLDHQLAAQRIGSIASSWYQKDPIAAMAWIDQLSNTSAKDTALTTLIHQTYSQDPELAATYLKKIQTPFKREDASVVVAMGLLSSTNRTADAIIKDLDLTANAAAKVRESAEQIRAHRYLN